MILASIGAVLQSHAQLPRKPEERRIFGRPEGRRLSRWKIIYLWQRWGGQMVVEDLDEIGLPVHAFVDTDVKINL